MDTPTRDQNPIEREAMRFLRTWNITISDDGIVSIRPNGPTLRLVELACLIQRLRTCCDGIFPSEIRFDLAGVRVVGAEPRLVARLISYFARSVNARCCLVGETGHA